MAPGHCTLCQKDYRNQTSHNTTKSHIAMLSDPAEEARLEKLRTEKLQKSSAWRANLSQICSTCGKPVMYQNISTHLKTHVNPKKRGRPCKPKPDAE